MNFPIGFVWFQPNQIHERIQNQDNLGLKYLLFWHPQNTQNENSAKISEQLSYIEEKGSGNEVEKDKDSIKLSKESKLLERDNQSGQVCSKIQRSETYQYKPKKEKKKELKKAVQSPQRNILPNILHQACCFIQMKKRSQKYVERYFTINPSQHSKQVMVSRFYSYQKLMKERVNPYLNLNGLKSLNTIQQPDCEIFSFEEQQIFLKLTRSLIKFFLENQLNAIILTSIRMKGESRVWHLQWKRKILQTLQNLFSEE